MFVDPVLLKQLQLMSLALFCGVSLENTIYQVSWITLLSVHMYSILWLKAWSAEPACKTILYACLSMVNACLVSPFL